MYSLILKMLNLQIAVFKHKKITQFPACIINISYNTHEAELQNPNH